MRQGEEQFFEGLLGLPLPKVAAAPPPPAFVEEPALRPVTPKNLFSNPDTNPVVLDFALLKQFKLEWLTWLPDTLFHEIEREFKTSIADINRTKIQATQTLHVVDTFWTDWEIFEKTIHALNSQIPLVDIMQPPDLSMLYLGIDLASSVRKETFNEEVSRYCAAVFLHEHVTYAPEPLAFCQPFISQRYYVCADCSKQAPAPLDWDGLCSSCAGHYLHEYPLALTPDPERVAKGWGKSVTTKLTYDPEPVRKRYDELVRLDEMALKTAISETANDIEAAKLVIAHDHMNHHRQQLAEQLKSLRPWLEAS